jgi:hypothetical protein
MMFVPQRKHTYEPPYFICRWRSYVTGNTYWPPQSLTGISLSFMLMYHRQKPIGRAETFGSTYYSLSYKIDMKFLRLSLSADVQSKRIHWYMKSSDDVCHVSGLYIAKEIPPTLFVDISQFHSIPGFGKFNNCLNVSFRAEEAGESAL